MHIQLQGMFAAFAGLAPFLSFICYDLYTVLSDDGASIDYAILYGK